MDSKTQTTVHDVCVVGAGYVGLTAAACFAHLGHRVRCLEADPRRLNMLRNGEIPIVEPGLEEIVRTCREEGRLSFTDEVSEAVPGAEVVLLCVGTPPRPDGDPDLRYLAAAATQVAQAATDSLVVVVKSTVPPGSCEAIELICSDAAAPGINIRVASSPEFLRESRAVEDFLKPDRVVIGAHDDDVADLVADLYPKGVPVVRCDRRGAELVKYAANAFLAVKISFANEVAALCESLGTESATVLSGVGLDHRIGTDFLRPGPGYGGSCLPKDVSGFQALGRSMQTPTAVVAAAEEANERARNSVLAKLDMALGGVAGKNIAVMGLAFKEGTDDTRDSPAVDLIGLLAASGAHVRAYDPIGRIDELAAVREDSSSRAIEGADALVFATAWPEFSLLDPREIANAMRGVIVMDAVGVVDIPAYEAEGLAVYGIGRGRPVAFHPIVWPPLRWAHTTNHAADQADPDSTRVAADLKAG